MAPTGDAYKIDWVLSNTSNIHIANHRDWFTNYAPIETFFEHAYLSSDKITAQGIGTVKLEVKTHRAKEEYRNLTLNNVLYCPTATVNIIGEPIFDTFPQWSIHDLRTDNGEIGMIFDIIRNPSGSAVRQKVWLKGHTPGASNYNPNSADMVSAVWSDQEIARCQKELQDRAQAQRDAKKQKGQDQEQRYTQVEKQWLKEHFKGEYFFLRDHGLSIYEKEERDQGRDIVRALMERDEGSQVCRIKHDNHTETHGTCLPEQESKLRVWTKTKRVPWTDRCCIALIPRGPRQKDQPVPREILVSHFRTALTIANKATSFSPFVVNYNRYSTDTNFAQTVSNADTAPKGKAYEVDWRLHNNSNVHLTNDRDWFTHYTPFETHFHCLYSNVKIKALGVGDVPLEVRTHPTRTGSRSHRTLALRNVRYCPEYPNNIVGSPVFDEYPIWNLNGIKDGTGKVGLILDNIEKGTASSVAATSKIQHPRYTTEEKAWLKKHYRGEYFFLRSYGLSIYKESNRDEGRDLVRSLMQEDRLAEVSEEEDSENDVEEHPMSHMADHYFNRKELAWIRKHYHHTGQFLHIYGLKPFVDADVQDGKRITESIFEEEGL